MATASEQVEQYHWYHSIELPGGIVTPGLFDTRGSAKRIGMPPSLVGKRCLDVGTSDGFWAFEMERRGAESVTAIDLEDPEALDWPASIRGQEKALDETKAKRFALAKRALGSERFKDEIEAALYRKVRPGKAGRLRKKTQKAD